MPDLPDAAGAALKANQAFYAAFNQRDLEAMSRLWACDVNQWGPLRLDLEHFWPSRPTIDRNALCIIMSIIMNCIMSQFLKLFLFE